jgi:hypothetical protein
MAVMNTIDYTVAGFVVASDHCAEIFKLKIQLACEATFCFQTADGLMGRLIRLDVLWIASIRNPDSKSAALCVARGVAAIIFPLAACDRDLSGMRTRSC